MKKTLIVAALLALGLAAGVQAANTDANRGTRAGQASSEARENQTGNAVRTEEKNQTKNQGESNRIRTEEQNAVRTEDGASDETDRGKRSAGSLSDTNPSVQKRSQVASAVHAMLQIAERSGGIGEQVRVIARNQNQNQTALEQNVEKIQNRNKFVKFLIGPNYGEIKDAQAVLEQNREQIRQLNQLRTQLQNSGDQQQLAEQIRVLEQANQGVEGFLEGAQGGFSLFGWLNKLVS